MITNLREIAEDREGDRTGRKPRVRVPSLIRIDAMGNVADDCHDDHTGDQNNDGDDDIAA